MKSINYISVILGGCVVLGAAIFWLLSALLPETFGAYNFAWFSFTILVGLGIIFVVNGLLQKNLITLKQFKIWIGLALIFLAIICLIFALALPTNIIIPIIAIVIAVGIVLSVFIGFGKKWDAGDNHKDGYKNYFERKKEEEQKEEQDKQETKESNKTEQE